MIKEQVRNLVGKAKLGEAIDTLYNWAHQNDNDLYNNLILLKSRFNTLRREETLGLLSSPDVNIQKNRLTQALFSYIEDIKDVSYQQYNSISSNSNNITTMNTFSIATLNKFLRDYKDKMYPKTKDTLEVIFELTKVCIIEATKSFEEGTEDYIEIIQPWKNTYSSTIRSGHPDGITELVEFLISFAESFAHNLEEQEVLDPKENLRKTAQDSTGDTAIKAIGDYVEYLISKSVGDIKKQLRIDWDTDKSQVISDNPFTKASRIRLLKAKYLN